MVQINLQQKSIQQVQVSPFKKADQQVVEDPFLPAPKLFYKDLVAPKHNPHCHIPNPPSNNTLRFWSTTGNVRVRKNRPLLFSSLLLLQLYPFLFTVIYVEKRQRGLILPCIWIVTEIVVVQNTAWMLDWCLLHILVWHSHGVTTPTCWHPVPTDLHSGTKRTRLLRSTTVFAKFGRGRKF